MSNFVDRVSIQTGECIGELARVIHTAAKAGDVTAAIYLIEHVWLLKAALLEKAWSEEQKNGTDT